jgi:hypothetical protein
LSSLSSSTTGGRTLAFGSIRTIIEPSIHSGSNAILRSPTFGRGNESSRSRADSPLIIQKPMVAGGRSAEPFGPSLLLQQHKDDSAAAIVKDYGRPPTPS